MERQIKIEYGSLITFSHTTECNDCKPVTQDVTGLLIGLLNGDLLVADVFDNTTYQVPRSAVKAIDYTQLDIVSKCVILVH